MKKNIALLILLLILTSVSTTLPAAGAPNVTVNGRPLIFDVEPIVENGRTLVPLRNIFEAMGSKISWDAYTGSITTVNNGTTIRLQIGNTIALKNEEQITLDVPPVFGKIEIQQMAT